MITRIPRPLFASSEVLEGQGIYLLDDLDCLWLYVGRSVQPTFLQESFAIGEHERPDFIEFNKASGQGCKMQAIVESIRKAFPYKHELKVSPSLSLSVYIYIYIYIYTSLPPSLSLNALSVSLFHFL